MDGNLSFIHTHYLTPKLAIQANLGINPLASRSTSKNNKFLRNFGIGFKLSSTNIEEELTNMEIVEDFEEFEYDRISSQHIK